MTTITDIVKVNELFGCTTGVYIKHCSIKFLKQLVY